jgi:hypothetical protein
VRRAWCFHPPAAQLDTLKTRVQSSAGASIGGVVRSVPDIGLRGLYRCMRRCPLSLLLAQFILVWTTSSLRCCSVCYSGRLPPAFHGWRGRGVLPAVSGQFVSHGLRTFAYEGSLTILKAITGGAAELQVLLLKRSSPLT